MVDGTRRTHSVLTSIEAWIFVFSPTDRFTRSPDVALRRFPEWRVCYAYTPANPDVHELNLTAWLILEMCEGQPLAEFERAFFHSVGRKIPRDQARAHLHQGLQDLVDRGILTCQRELPFT
jgi:hypothetical protein